MALPLLIDRNWQSSEIDRSRADLQAELAAIKPITKWTFVCGGQLMLIPPAYGAALAKLFT